MNDPRTGNHDASTRVEGEDRLDSWKRIATYLKRDVSTVQRWERRESMPVHRHQHDKLGSVFAFRSELDAWWTSRQAELAEDEGAASSEPPQRAPGESGTVTTRLPTRSQKLWLAALALVLVFAAIGWYAVRSDLFWRSPLAGAKFTPVLDFSGEQEAAAISRDGKQFAFIAESEGKIDAWLSAVNSGRYRNLTNGRVGELINPATRTLGFSADSELVFVWTRQAEGFHPTDVNIMAAPTATPTTSSGSLQPYLAGAAELDSSHDGKRIVYHTTAPGDPLFIRDLSAPSGTADRRVYVAPDGVHCHFPVWSDDDAYIYFVRGVPPDEWDVWRVRATGADPERITAHNSRVAYPVLLDRRTLLYLAYDAERAGPWIYAMDVERRVPHRISLGVETFTSLAASADGLRLIASVANPRTSIWRMKLENGATPTLLSPNGSHARFAEHGLVYVAESANGQGLWKSDEDTRSEIWNATHGRIVGAPALSPDRRHIAFHVEDGGRSKLYMAQADGSQVRLLANSLLLRGNPSWAPDGQSIVIAALHDGKPNLTRVFLDGAAPTSFTSEYSIDPAWSPDGRFLVYTGSDVGTTFPLRAAAADGHPYPLPGIMLTRGARRVTFLPNSQALVILSGGIGHKNLALLDLETAAQRPLANLPADFNIRDFDISADGSELVFERVEANSHIALIERKP